VTEGGHSSAEHQDAEHGPVVRGRLSSAQAAQLLRLQADAAQLDQMTELRRDRCRTIQTSTAHRRARTRSRTRHCRASPAAPAPGASDGVHLGLHGLSVYEVATNTNGNTPSVVRPRARITRASPPLANPRDQQRQRAIAAQHAPFIAAPAASIAFLLPPACPRRVTVRRARWRCA
jgi:hypothetical protein